MPRKKPPNKPYILPERYDPSQPLLRELVFVHVYLDRGESFDMLLTRIPCLGEEIDREDRSYKVTRVRHEPVDDDGRARLGWHAFLDADLMPPEDEDLILSTPRRRAAKRGKK